MSADDCSTTSARGWNCWIGRTAKASRRPGGSNTPARTLAEPTSTPMKTWCLLMVLARWETEAPDRHCVAGAAAPTTVVACDEACLSGRHPLTCYRLCIVVVTPRRMIAMNESMPAPAAPRCARASSVSAWAARSSRRSPRTAAVDHARLVAHARHCLAEGCSSFTLFGTTGEGASLGLRERAAMLDAVVAAGFDMSRQVLAGVAASSIEDAAAQANQLFDAGGRGVLLAPPFYFKGPGDEGLYRWFSTVLERCRSPREVILYHIPSVTQVPLSSTLIGRIDRAFPGVVAGDQGLERRLGDDRSATSPTTRSCTSWSATSASSRGPSATAAAARSTASRTSARACCCRWSTRAPKCPGSPRWSTSCCASR